MPDARVSSAPVAEARADAWLRKHRNRLLSLDDFEIAARRHLPRPVFGYVAGAAETDWSLDDNRAAFAEFGFLPRVLVDVSKRSQQATLFGHTYSAPFGIAPLGISALYAYRGDLVLAAAAAAANVPMIVSGSSLIRLEDVASASPGAWFQAYLPGDVPRITALIERVAACRLQDARRHRRFASRGQPREQHPRRVFDAAATDAAPRLGRHHASAVAFRNVPADARLDTACRTSRTTTRPAAPPILSPDILRDYSDRGHLELGTLVD